MSQTTLNTHEITILVPMTVSVARCSIEHLRVEHQLTAGRSGDRCGYGKSQMACLDGERYRVIGSLIYEEVLTTKGFRAALIDLVWVHPRCRGTSLRVGSQLMERCLRQLELSNIQVVYLLVSAANHRAQRTYQRAQFQDLGGFGWYRLMGRSVILSSSSKSSSPTTGVVSNLSEVWSDLEKFFSDGGSKHEPTKTANHYCY